MNPSSRRAGAGGDSRDKAYTSGNGLPNEDMSMVNDWFPARRSLADIGLECYAARGVNPGAIAYTRSDMALRN
jgi:hypothetical protein